MPPKANWLLRAALLAASLLVVILLSATLLTMTGPGRSVTASLVSQIASSPDQSIEISGLDQVFGNRLALQELTLSDDKGVWAEIRDIEIGYSLGALIGRNIDLSKARIGSIEIFRFPDAGAASQQSTAPLQLLPAPLQSLSLNSLDIGEISFAKQVFGTPKRLHISGNASAQNIPLQTSGNLVVEDLDSKRQMASAVWAVDPNSDNLAAQLSFSEQADGMLARLLDVPGLPALDVQLETSGPLSALAGKLAIALDNKQTVQGNLLLGLGDEVQTLSVNLNGQLAPLLPDQLVPFVAGGSNLAFNATRGSDGSVQLQQATFNSALTSAELQGAYNAKSDEMNFTLEGMFSQKGTEVAFGPAGSPDQFRLGNISLRAAMDGALQNASLTVDAELESFVQGAVELGNGTVSVKGEEINFLESNGKFSANSDIEKLQTGIEQLDELLTGQLSLQSNLNIANQQVELSQASLKGGKFAAQVAGKYDMGNAKAEMNVDASINPSAGGIYKQLFSESGGTLSAQLFSDGGRLEVRSLQSESDNLNFALQGVLDNNEIDVKGNASLADLNSFDATLVGAVNVDIQANGPINNPTTLIKLNGQDLSVAGEPIKDVSGEISGLLQEGIKLDLSGVFKEQKISTSAIYTGSDSGSHILNDLVVIAPATQIKGQLAIEVSGMANGQIQFYQTDLKQIAPLLLQEQLEGAISGSLLLSGDGGQQSAQLQLTAPALSVQGTNVKALNVNLVAADLLGDGQLEGTATIEQVIAGGEKIQNVETKILGPLSNLAISLDARSNDAPIVVNATMQNVSDGTVVNIDEFKLTYKDLPVRLRQTAQIKIADGNTQINVPFIGIGSGTAALSGDIAEKLDLELKLNDISVAELDAVAPSGQGAQGTISADVFVTGTIADPKARYQYSLRGASILAARTNRLSSLNSDGTGTFQNGRLSIASTLSGGASASVNGDVNLTAQSVNVGVSGNLPFAYIAQPLSRAGILASGAASIEAQITGPIAAPRFRGVVKTQGASLQEVASKLSLGNISSIIILNNDRAEVQELSGDVASGGRITITGNTSLRAADALNSDFDIKLNDVKYEDGVVATSMNATLKLTGPIARSGVLSGSVAIAQANITIPENLPNSVSPVDITHKSAPTAVKQQARELAPANSSGSSGSTIRLDIDVNAPRRIYIRGRGLDAELGGRIKVSGTTSNPRATGQISLQRGRLELLTKRFDFDTGRVTFAGPLDPTLNFRANTRDGSAIYSILVQGYASEPEFLFSSSPSLPQDEIIANMFFGKSLSSLSALQIAQLANAVATLNGSNSGPGLLDRLRNLSGVDNIDVKSNESGETTVGIGGYLNDRTYLNVEKGTAAKDDKIIIDLEITDSLKARGETSGDGNTKAGIFFEQDY
ncbi:translocation/assembly module TamB domain-containing protein [Maritalea sp.]|uniref:translocation/assembly module TamB domain-containing protein n=1 Tax=Maritalea sp. TaxID=2003361 RepID=UPI003EF6F32D